jgi:predicted transcriptional regulator
MRDGSTLDYAALRDEARSAIDASGKSQSEVADDLGVHRSAVSRALKTAGPKFQELQRRIIEGLTPYRIERRVSFKAHRDG